MPRYWPSDASKKNAGIPAKIKQNMQGTRNAPEKSINKIKNLPKQNKIKISKPKTKTKKHQKMAQRKKDPKNQCSEANIAPCTFD